MSKWESKSAAAVVRESQRHKLTWEQRVYYSIPARYVPEACAVLCEQAGISRDTLTKRYLRGQYPSPIVRDAFRQLLKEVYERYTKLAQEEIKVELD